MTIRPDDARDEIEALVTVTPQLVHQARAYIIGRRGGESRGLIHDFPAHVGRERPSEIVLDDAAKYGSGTKAAAHWIESVLAACEAMWSLIGTGAALPAGSGLHEYTPQLAWTTGNPGATNSAGFDFPMLKVWIPRSLMLAPSLRSSADKSLSDPDVYVATVGPVSAEVAEALGEADECFRRGLYTASLAMLAKAAEAAWSEFAERLLAAAKGNDRGLNRLREQLIRPQIGLGDLVTLATELYSRADLFGELRAASGISITAIRDAATWSDQVRDGRNVLHYRVTPRTPNTFEKVAALLLGAGGSLRALQTVITASKG